MRNYVIINGVNSLTIQGLAIKTLPPITKPIQRNLREEIDGRDGDIVTPLGYGAYDKTIEIGLFGTFDIDEVIAFFNQKGTITFSNEADKVYYFEALDQVDYAELLKFRTANVVLHCQPFKYPLNETPLVEEYEYVEATGSNVTLDNTSEAIFNKIDLLGNTEQTQYTGKNLIDYSMVDANYTQLYDTGYYKLTFPGNKKILEGAFEENTQYTLSFMGYRPGQDGNGGGFNIVYTDSTQDMIRVNTSNATSYNVVSNANKTISYIFVTWGSTNISYLKDLQLEKGNTKTDYEPYVGGVPSPNPSYPQPIQVVSGDNEISICGKNLLNKELIVSGNTSNYEVTQLSTGVRILHKNSYTTGVPTLTLTLKPNTTYTFSQKANATSGSPGSGIKTTNGSYSYVTTGSKTITTESDGVIIILFGASLGSGVSCDYTDIQLEQSSTATTYEPYQSQSYAVNLGTLELCKIGDYQDYIYKDNGNWYVHKEIGKVVLNGSESWSDFSAGNSNFRCQYDVALPNILTPPTNPAQLFSNYFKAISRDNAYAKTEIGIAQYGSTLGKIFICAPNTILSEQTLAQWKTWLSTHNTIVYYVLATPTINPITDEDLIEQLEALWNATSYRGQTNITQTSNDLPFMMEVSALKLGSDHLEVDNTGNIYSKPTIELEGTGIVDIYLNDVQVFEVDLSEVNHIVIDTEKMEAYNPTDNTLANRKVTGDYSTFKLNVGTNDLRFSGDLTSATITRYKRWV